jgi:anti-sigma B factor antagonist
MKFNSEIKHNALILRLEGDLIGASESSGMLTTVSDAVQQKIKNCVIDISNLRYVNSSGIGILITILTKFRNKGGEVYLLKPSESVQKLLVITKLNAIFQVIHKEEEILN